METRESFSTLLNTAREELEKTQQQGAAHFARGDTVQVRQAADRVEKIKGWIAALERIQKEWDIPAPEAKPQPPVLSVHSEKTSYSAPTHGEKINFSLPKGLADVLEVCTEIFVNKLSYSRACEVITKKRRLSSTHTVEDACTRRIGLNTAEFRILLNHRHELSVHLSNQFPDYSAVIHRIIEGTSN